MHEIISLCRAQHIIIEKIALTGRSYFSIAKEVEQAGAELDHIAMKTFNFGKLRDVLLGENKIRYKHLKSIRF